MTRLRRYGASIGSKECIMHFVASPLLASKILTISCKHPT